MRIVREAAQLAVAMKIELTDMPPLPVPSIAHATDAHAIEIIHEVGQRFLDNSPEHRMSAQQDVLRGSRLEYEETLGYALAKARELGVPMPTLDTCYRILDRGPPMKWGHVPICLENGDRPAFLIAATCAGAALRRR